MYFTYDIVGLLQQSKTQNLVVEHNILRLDQVTFVCNTEQVFSKF